MIEVRNGDVFKQDDVNIVIHQANCMVKMGRGIAATIAKDYPEAVYADQGTTPGDKDKLGTFTTAFCEESGLTIYNLYGQYHWKSDKRRTNYIAFAKGLDAIKQDIEEIQNAWPWENGPVIGIPYYIGCGLAGGDWTVVNALIQDCFEDSDIKVVICKI